MVYTGGPADTSLIIQVNFPMTKRLTKSKDKKLFGVAGGVAEYFDVDPTIVRVGIVILCFFVAPVIFIAYVALAFLMPSADVEITADEPVEAPPTRNLFAWALIGFGVVIVLSKIGFPHFDNGWLLPLALVGIGMALLSRRSRLN